MNEQPNNPPPPPGAPARYRHLPDPVPPDQWIEEQPASDPPDPDLGRDPNHDWMLRG